MMQIQSEDGDTRKANELKQEKKLLHDLTR